MKKERKNEIKRIASPILESAVTSCNRLELIHVFPMNVLKTVLYVIVLVLKTLLLLRFQGL